MKKEIDELSEHYVLAGFGRVGREASRELAGGGRSVVVIDVDPENLAEAAELGWLVIRGDASDDDVLRAAGIERARGLLVTTSNDATNLYVVMSARLLSPELFIVSRAVDSNAAPKLERAGADRAISPYAIGGRRMAHLMLSPHVVDFVETALHRGTQALSIGEIRVAPGSRADGASLDTLRKRDGGATVMAVLRAEGGPVAVAKDDLVLHSGDHLLALGTEEQLQVLESALGS